MEEKIQKLLKGIQNGEFKALARSLSIVENESGGHLSLLENLDLSKRTPVIGITGPPGAGKSTLVNGLLAHISKAGKKAGVLAADPTSPFNFGSLLGDRIRMTSHSLNPKIFIRSVASRGSLGGLSSKTLEMADVMRTFDFDYIFVETVGVGQSEVEIAGLADVTAVILVPEAGDEVQVMKSGLMEIADVFVVNKSDRESADRFAKNLTDLVHEKGSKGWQIPVLKSIAHKNEGIPEIFGAFEEFLGGKHFSERKKYLLAEKAYNMIREYRMRDIDKKNLILLMEKLMQEEGFNLYRFVRSNFYKG